MKLTDNNNSEIEQYVNGRSPFISFHLQFFPYLCNLNTRYLSASEAIWRLLTFKLTKRSHAVVKLACHLEDEQQVSIWGQGLS